MHRIFGLVSRFRRHEGGAFAVTFAIMAIVMIAFGGAVVDYVALEQTRSRAQTSLDAAALALQPEIFNTATTKEAIRVKAENLLLGGIAGEWGVTASIPPSGIVINTVDGSLYLRAEMTMPTIFVNLVGVPQLNAQVESQATRKKLALEVVMVLDNSGSMLTTSKNPTTGVMESRMAKLKEAATCATNTIFYDKVNNNASCTPATGSKLLDNVKMGVVPFTMYVNVGAGNANQPWIDKAGTSPIANDNLDNDGNASTAFTSAVDRLALYDDITNDNWRGCVEARPHISSGATSRYYDTDDTTPVSGSPATLFVPLFAPDISELTAGLNAVVPNYTEDSPAQCDRPTGTNVRCTYTEVKKTCSAYGTCSGAITNTYAFTGPVNFAVNARYYVGGYPPSCDCRAGWTTDTGTNTYTGSGSNRTYTRVRTCNTTYKPTGLTAREYQERMCKYQGNIGYTTAQKGPNADCPYQALTPLTQTPATVQTTITNMVADGGTNIHEGTAWGYRVLSPTVPFIEGGAYSEATSKVMIIMTDGENTAYRDPAPNAASVLNGSNYFSAYGYPYNSGNTDANSSSGGGVTRLGVLGSTNAQLVNEMNARTLQTCTNAKAQGITVYTIGLSVDDAKQSTPAVVRDMLTKCASNATFAFFPDQPSELRAVFQKIASQLTALRLAL